MEHNMFCKFMAYHRKDGECYCNTEMRPAGWESVDPGMIKQGANLYDYERAEKDVRETFAAFSRREVAVIWKLCGWKKFFAIDWWKFKFRLLG